MVRSGLDARRKLRDDQATIENGIEQLPVGPRVDHVRPGTEYRNGIPSSAEHTFVNRSVDAECEAAHDGCPGSRQSLAQPLSDVRARDVARRAPTTVTHGPGAKSSFPLRKMSGGGSARCLSPSG